ncbi:hypothetical protein JOM56_014865 [Amanita muscaria]
MPSKLVKLQSIFVLLFFCTSMLSVGGIELLQYPKCQANEERVRTWVGRSTYSHDGDVTREFLNGEATETLKWLRSHITVDEMRPTVVSALAVDKNIYFASSAKGKGKVFDDPKIHFPEVVKKALKKCGEVHRYNQRCGEIMVVAWWYHENPGKKLIDAKFRRIIAVDTAGTKDPCQGGKGRDGKIADYGCDNFLKEVLSEEEVFRKPPPTAKPPRRQRKKAQMPKKPSTARKHRRTT